MRVAIEGSSSLNFLLVVSKRSGRATLWMKIWCFRRMFCVKMPTLLDRTTVVILVPSRIAKTGAITAIVTTMETTMKISWRESPRIVGILRFNSRRLPPPRPVGDEEQTIAHLQLEDLVGTTKKVKRLNVHPLRNHLTMPQIRRWFQYTCGRIPGWTLQRMTTLWCLVGLPSLWALLWRNGFNSNPSALKRRTFFTLELSTMYLVEPESCCTPRMATSCTSCTFREIGSASHEKYPVGLDDASTSDPALLQGPRLPACFR